MEHFVSNCHSFLGRILEAASENIFLLMLLLLAQGYTVTKGRLKMGAAVRLTVFMCLYSAGQIALFAWENQVIILLIFIADDL